MGRIKMMAIPLQQAEEQKLKKQVAYFFMAMTFLAVMTTALIML